MLSTLGWRGPQDGARPRAALHADADHEHLRSLASPLGELLGELLGETLHPAVQSSSTACTEPGELRQPLRSR